MITWIIVVILILAAAACAEIYYELHHFSVNHYQVTAPSFQTEEIRAVFLSDLHNRTYGKNNDKLLEAIRQARPDLILIGGDMLVGKPGVSWLPAYDFVSALPEIAPVYYASGNHEERMKEEPERYGDEITNYQNALKDCGVIFLENDAKMVRCRGVDLCICGLELPMSVYRKFHKAPVSERTITDCVGAKKPVYTILLAHNPSYVPAYEKWGADLILCGHLHGGLVRIPGFGGVVTPQGFLFPKYSGELTEENGKHVVVSRGLGTHTLNIRLFNKPELIVLHMKKAL